MAKEMTIRQRVRGWNILFPWFKVVAGTLIGVLVAVLIIGVWRRGGDFEVRDGGEGGIIDVELEGVEAQTVMLERLTATYVRSRPSGVGMQKSETVRNAELIGKKLIALTFDDGPSYATTPRLLDILKNKGVKATFFVIGGRAQAAPDVLQREEVEGHVVGSHTMGHVDLSKMDIGMIRQDGKEMQGVFQGVLGHNVGLTRPPYGAINDTVKVGVGQPLVIWSIDPEDWKVKDAEMVRRHIVEKAFDGAIVLMHDIYESTVDAVEMVIDDLRSAGYEFVTVPEMAKMRGVVLENGGVYGSFRP